MSKADKILAKMRHNTRDWHIEDIKVIADRFKIEYKQPGSSHVTFRARTGEKVTVPAHKPVKPIYIKLFLAMLDGLGENHE